MSSSSSSNNNNNSGFSFEYKSEPVPIPSSSNEEQAYKDIIRQLAAQAPEPYGAIPPLIKRKDKSKKKKSKKPIRRMSHVENWLAVDSKESIPDEEELVHSSPFRNFLSTDFLVLPLHMPPPSLSATTEDDSKDLRPVLYPIKEPPIQVIPIRNAEQQQDDDDLEEEEDESEEEEEEEEELIVENNQLKRKTSIPSFSKSHQPSTSTTKSYAMSTSPPSSSANVTSTAATTNTIENRWLETIAQLRKSLTLSRSTEKTTTPNNNKKSNFIPMPLPPKRNVRKKRRSEATTQPRFNPETNTYTRDTRSNPDHLRMISAELNMMRHKKLSSPLKPRGFLPRRQDVFIRGSQRKLSNLKYEL